MQGVSQSGARAVVAHRAVDARQHGVGVGLAKRGVQVGQLGAKGKHRAWHFARGLVQERQQPACIHRHRTGHVHQDEQRQGLFAALQMRQAHQLAVVACCRLHGAGPVEPRALPAGGHTSATQARQVQVHITQQALHVAHVLGAEASEIGLTQARKSTGTQRQGVVVWRIRHVVQRLRHGRRGQGLLRTALGGGGFGLIALGRCLFTHQQERRRITRRTKKNIKHRFKHRAVLGP